jgi:UDP-3-O-[3-hydroxymyristoyl] glucosamine N-acyltransferase
VHSGVKLDNLIQVGHNVEIGSNTVMSAQVGIAGTTKIGSNCFVGGQVGFADHITVGNNCKIGSQSGIDKKVPDGEIRFGSPALPGIQYHRSFAVFRNLPEMATKLREIEKRVNKLEE